MKKVWIIFGVVQVLFLLVIGLIASLAGESSDVQACRAQGGGSICDDMEGVSIYISMLYLVGAWAVLDLAMLIAISMMLMKTRR